MVFDNRLISEITDQDLIALIGNQEENLWIDFKKMEYHKDETDLEKHKREICKDVTAMANAEGGYILIGVDEKDKIANGFFTVCDADKVAISIRDTCHQFIDRRILNLEVELRTFQWNSKDITLVIIHIPPSEIGPHGFKWGNSTNFVKRYGDVTKEYPMSELGDVLSARHYPPIIGSIDRKLDTILANTQADLHYPSIISSIDRRLDAVLGNTQTDIRTSISPQDSALEQGTVADLLRLMDSRFDEAISDEPYYRILAVPEDINPHAIDTRDEDIRKTMCNPPDRRYGNFGVTGILEREMSPSSEGISGPNVTGGEITLLKNGFLEVRCPLRDTQFQWRHHESGLDTEWIYPYVICEFPVTFLRLVKRIYGASDINSSVVIQQTYHNLTDFMLVRGNPSNIGFGAFSDERKVYTDSLPIISKRTVNPDFEPDHEAYDLVKDVYDSFGLEAQWIPAFDENGNFILK